MNEFKLTWVVVNGQGGRVINPGLEDIKKSLARIAVRSGSVILEINGGPEIGPRNLQVQSEAGLYLLMLGEDNGEDFVTRTFTRKSDSDGFVSILGNSWSRKLVCSNFELVVAVFDEFVSTGDVRRDILG